MFMFSGSFLLWNVAYSYVSVDKENSMIPGDLITEHIYDTCPTTGQLTLLSRNNKVCISKQDNKEGRIP